MNTLTESINATAKRLAELLTVVSSEPAFNHWHPAGFADPGLVQLFPNTDTTPIAARQEQAKAIARVFGGAWKRDVSDGSWRNEGGSFRVILHRVDKMERMETPIDLSVPAPIAVADEREVERDEIPPSHALERAAVAEAKEIEKYGMPEL